MTHLLRSGLPPHCGPEQTRVEAEVGGGTLVTITLGAISDAITEIKMLSKFRNSWNISPKTDLLHIFNYSSKTTRQIK